MNAWSLPMEGAEEQRNWQKMSVQEQMFTKTPPTAQSAHQGTTNSQGGSNPSGQRRKRGKALDRRKENAGKKQRQRKWGWGGERGKKEAIEIWKIKNKMP